MRGKGRAALGTRRSAGATQAVAAFWAHRTPAGDALRSQDAARHQDRSADDVQQNKKAERRALNTKWQSQSDGHALRRQCPNWRNLRWTDTVELAVRVSGGSSAGYTETAEACEGESG